jgi:uncharacterized protein YecT (DUF1311 family)
MKIKITKEKAKKVSKEKIQWNAVTWYSKLAAIIVLFALLPMLTFYIGNQYAQTKNIFTAGAESIVPVEEGTPVSSDGVDVSCWNTAQSQYELNMCASDVAHAYTDKLTEAYKTLFSISSDFKDIQKAWITYRDKECTAEASFYDGGSIKPLIHDQCIASVTKDQLNTVQRIIEDEQDR